MFNICNDVFNDLDLPINASKCHCLRIGPRFKIPCASLQIQGVKIKWVHHHHHDGPIVAIKYLGVTIICKANNF